MFPLFASSPLTYLGETETDRWHAEVKVDYELCRILADQHGSRLERSAGAQRVGWEKAGHTAYGILLPDPLLRAGTEDEWYFYYVWGETLLRRTSTERAERRMLVLAESVDDWAELLRLALRPIVGDSRYEILSDYTDALGETEDVPDGFIFRLFAHAPGAVRPSDLCVTGHGRTPREAARDACRHWVEEVSSSEF